jgi:hypothetical protein
VRQGIDIAALFPFWRSSTRLLVNGAFLAILAIMRAAAG